MGKECCWLEAHHTTPIGFWDKWVEPGTLRAVSCDVGAQAREHSGPQPRPGRWPQGLFRRGVYFSFFLNGSH